MTEIIKSGEGHVIAIDGKPYAKILAAEGATDTFERIEASDERYFNSHI